MAIIAAIIITIVLASIVIAAVVAAFMEDQKWSAVKQILREPIGSGEFCVSGDVPDATFDGRRYTAVFFKDLHRNPMKGYRFQFYFVHDKDDFFTKEFGPTEIDASGLSEMDYIKKVVYKL